MLPVHWWTTFGLFETRIWTLERPPISSLWIIHYSFVSKELQEPQLQKKKKQIGFERVSRVSTGPLLTVCCKKHRDQSMGECGTHEYWLCRSSETAKTEFIATICSVFTSALWKENLSLSWKAPSSLTCEKSVTAYCISLALSWNPQGGLVCLFAVGSNIHAHPAE